MSAPVFRLFTALLLLLAFTPAHAESLSPGAPTHIHTTLIAERAATPGETITLALLMQPDKDWHGYWSNPGDAGLPLTLDWTLPKGATAGALQFPVPQKLVVAGLMNHVYVHDFAILIPLTVPRDAKPGTSLPISAKAQWLACTTAICVPEEATIATTISIAAPGTTPAADPRFAAWRTALPAPLDQPAHFATTATGYRLAIPFPARAAISDPHVFLTTDGVINYAAPQNFSRNGDTLVVDLARATTPPASAPTALAGVLSLGPDGSGISLTAQAGPVPATGEPLAGAAPPAAFSWKLLGLSVLGALLGGLILNIMPCVFPILSLKALALARGNTQNAHLDALAYSAGVILACLVLGGVMLGLRAAGSEVGWAFQLQNPGVIAVLLLLAVAITANFAGLYTNCPACRSRPARRVSMACSAHSAPGFWRLSSPPPAPARSWPPRWALHWSCRWSPRSRCSARSASAWRCRSWPSASSPRCAASCPAPAPGWSGFAMRWPCRWA